MLNYKIIVNIRNIRYNILTKQLFLEIKMESKQVEFVDINLNIKNFCKFDPNKIEGYKTDFIIAGEFLQNILTDNVFTGIDFWIFNEKGFKTLKQFFNNFNDEHTYYIGLNHFKITNTVYNIDIYLICAFDMSITDVLDSFELPSFKCYYDFGVIRLYPECNKAIDTMELNIDSKNVCECLILCALKNRFKFNENFYIELNTDNKFGWEPFPNYDYDYDDHETSSCNYKTCDYCIRNKNYYCLTGEQIQKYEEYIHNKTSRYVLIINDSYEIQPFLKQVYENSIKKRNACLFCKGIVFNLDEYAKNSSKITTINTEPNIIEENKMKNKMIYRNFVISDRTQIPVINKLYETYLCKPDINTDTDINKDTYIKSKIYNSILNTYGITEKIKILDLLLESDEINELIDDNSIDSSIKDKIIDTISELYVYIISYHLNRIINIDIDNYDSNIDIKEIKLNYLCDFCKDITKYKNVLDLCQKTNIKFKIYKYTTINKMFEFAAEEGAILPWLTLINMVPELVGENYYPLIRSDFSKNKINYKYSLKCLNDLPMYEKELQIFHKYYNDSTIDDNLITLYDV
jgi:hypothetical protein